MLELLIGLVLIYSILLAWFVINLKASRLPQPKSAREQLPSISVVVAARNEEQTLPKLISALQNQTYPADAFEVIIADDRSTDGTAGLLNQYALGNPHLKIITITATPEGWAPKKWALNSAIQASSAEIILQTDADCRPSQTWIATLTAGFSDPVTGFISAPAPLTAHKNFLDDLFEMESLAQDALSAGSLSAGITLSCTGRNIAFRREVFNEVSGYSGIEHFLSGDDDLLLQKISTHSGLKIKFLASPGAVVESDPPKSLEQFIHQRLRFASKGINYYELSTGLGMKFILPLIYLTNLSVLISLLVFTETAEGLWLVPYLLKSLSDGYIVFTFYKKIGYRWSLRGFLLLSLLHPLYVVVFGLLGPLVKSHWKEA